MFIHGLRLHSTTSQWLEPAGIYFQPIRWFGYLNFKTYRCSPLLPGNRLHDLLSYILLARSVVYEDHMSLSMRDGQTFYIPHWNPRIINFDNLSKCPANMTPVWPAVNIHLKAPSARIPAGISCWTNLPLRQRRLLSTDPLYLSLRLYALLS